MFLKIENPGVAPVEGWTVFGATTKRDSEDEGMIGTFGSGNKHGTMLLMRKGKNPVVFCDMLRLNYFSRPVTVKGVASSVEQRRVCVKYAGKDQTGKSCSSEEELSVFLDYGTANWDDIALALREYVSNAIDACSEQGIDFREVKVEVVSPNQVRAKAGTTRVFVPLDEDVQNFYNDIGKWFLHFSEPENLGKRILPKRNRNLNGREAAVIYRRGVRVREVVNDDTPSLFDYNLPDLKLDESRQVDDWNVRAYAAQAIRWSDKDVLTQVFKAIITAKKVWEVTAFDAYTLEGGYFHEPKDRIEVISKNWREAWENVAGDKGVLTSAVSVVADMVERKGFKPCVTKAENWLSAAKKLGVRSDDSVLTADDRSRRTYSEATEDVKSALEYVWSRIECVSLTHGKPKPKVRCFFEPMEGEAQKRGIYADGMISIHSEIAKECPMLRIVMLEEVAHHVSGATDLSRDFQMFLVRLASELMGVL